MLIQPFVSTSRRRTPSTTAISPSAPLSGFQPLLRVLDGLQLGELGIDHGSDLAAHRLHLRALLGRQLLEFLVEVGLGQVLEHGCRVWLTPSPFDHTKLMLVDDHWALFGSGNWDPRSLRLNFELCVESYEPELAGQMADLVRGKIQQAEEITLEDVDGRSLPVRLRDGLARLFQPYL